MSIKVKYLDVTGETEAAVASVSQGQPFSAADAVTDGGADSAYATLEPAGWPLDGSRVLFSDAPMPVWWSAQASDENGIFSEAPVLTLSLPAPCTASGISFRFSEKTGHWCSRVRVTWLRGTLLLAQRSAEPDGPQWSLSQTVEDFDTVRVELLQTSVPRSFAKVTQIKIGLIHWFFGDEITAATLVGESDHMLADLTVDTMTVKLRDEKSRQLRPQKNQRMELYRDDQLVATQYITSSTRESGNWYTVSCQGTIGLLEDDFLGGIYEKVPAQQVLTEILGGIEYETDPIFEESTVTGYLPVCSRREALQQLAFALGAVVSTRGSGTVRLLQPQTHVSHIFRGSEIFQGGKMETQPRIARVELTAHSYRVSEEREALLQDEYVGGSDVVFTFREPHHSYEITGGTITGSGANWVSITADSEVTLTAGKYIHSQTLYTRQNPAAGAAERSSLLSVPDATLIHRDNAAAVLGRLYDGAAQRQVLTFDAVVTDQYPGQMVTSEDMWGSLVQGTVTSMQWELTQNGQTAQVTVCGRQVPAQIANFYAGELISGSEEVEYLCS